MTDLNLQSVIDNQPQWPGTADRRHPHQIVQFERYEGYTRIGLHKPLFPNEAPRRKRRGI